MDTFFYLNVCFDSESSTLADLLSGGDEHGSVTSVLHVLDILGSLTG